MCENKMQVVINGKVHNPVSFYRLEKQMRFCGSCRINLHINEGIEYF